jgi:hypothetical protein
MLTPLAEAGKIVLPVVPEECEHNSHMFYIKTAGIDERTALSAFLKENGIGSAFHYVPLHTAPAGTRFGRFHGEDRYTTDTFERLLRMPMYYGLSRDEVIKIHTASDYLIYMLGFTPGFTYLGGLNDKIETPRLKTPRVKIPAGSVGIAGKQTGVYPIDSPGGWQLIGRTPVRMYDPDRAEPILPQAGQYIKFYAIDKAEYDKIAAQDAAGTYVCKRHPRKEGAK